MPFSYTLKYAARLQLLFAALLLASCGGGGGGGGGGTTATASGSLPDLAITSVSAPSSGVAGGSFTVTVTVANQGSVVAAGVSAIVALAPSSDITADYGMLGLGTSMVFLNPGQSTTLTVTANLPTGAANGSYYIGAIVPYGPEVTKTNNVYSQPFTLSGGTTCTPDTYEPDNSAAAAGVLVFGNPQAHNHCEGTSDWLSFNATQGTTYALSTSQVGYNAWTNITLYDTDGGTALVLGSPGLDFKDSRLTWTAPKTGTYYARVAPMMGLLDAGAATDYSINLGDLRPDLVITNLSAPTNGVPNGAISVYTSVRNQGFAGLAGNFDIAYYLSTDNVLDAADTLIGTQTVTGGLTVGSYTNYAPYTASLPNVAVGNYYILAKANPTGAASEYSTANNVSAAQPISVVSATCSDDSYEPDNAAASAQPITVGVPQAHTHCLNTTDWVKFSATAGTSYMISVTPVGGYAAPTVQLYDTDGVTLLQPASGTATTINWTAPATATYYLLATDSASAAKDYSIAVNLALPDLTESLATQYTSTVVAGDFLNITETVSNIGYQNAGAFTIGTYLSSTSTISSANTLLATRNVSSLGAQGTGSYQYINQAWYGAHIAASTPPGTYYIGSIADPSGAVTEVSKANNTSAPVAITVVAPPCAIDAYEDDDTPATAKAITAGSSQSRNNCDDGIDWATFTPTVTGVYLATTGSFGPSFTVLQSDAVTPVTTQGSNFQQLYSWSATAGSTYYFQITNGFPGSGTGYTLGVTQCAQDAYEEDDTVAAAKAIIVGAAAQSRNHCEDQHDWVTFTATAGTKYTITGGNVGTAASVTVRLYDATGTNLLASGTSAQGGKTNVISWTAPASGTYTIDATEPFTFGQNTDYTLQVQ
ncbi:MAG TPA: CARDB domain-containing protein [Gallionellaceae bacterium]